MGVVYRATQLRLTRTVALKLVTPALARDTSFRERFRREWMIAASIEHPNVIPVYEAGEEDGALYIAMRWVDGTDLRETLDRGALEPARAARLVAQVANALDAAHEHGLIHRDVKPGNILITGQDHVYLTDFGLTKHATSISGLTKTGQWVGTVDYMAPEQIEGAPVSARTDVYSLGCVLFEALTGTAPYKRDAELAKLWAHVHAPPPSVLEVSPGASPQLDEVVRRAMAKDPAERYASAGDLGRAALAAVAGAEPAPAPEPARPIPTPRDEPASKPAEARQRWTPGRRVVLGAVGLLLAAAIVAAVFLSGSDEPQTESAGPGSSAPLRTASAWRPLPNMPTARQNMVGTVSDGTIWVLGGLAAGSSGSRRVEGYDPVINAWKTGPDLPLRLHHEMAVTYKGEVVVIGGWVPEGSEPSAQTSRRVFALHQGRWVPMPPLNQPRAAGAAAVVGDKIVVAGGQADGRLIAPTEVFDGKQWRIATDIPTPREHLAAASDGKYVYVVGGRRLSPDKNSAALERYDPAADRWAQLPDMPTPRGGLGAAVTRGHLLAVGGENPTAAMGTVQSYGLARKRWSTAARMRIPRHGIAVAAIGRSLYSLGGGSRPGHASASATAQILRLAR
jgi:non-specific serine/threonine protein kinase